MNKHKQHLTLNRLIKPIASLIILAAVTLSLLFTFPATRVSAVTKYPVPSSGTLLYAMDFKARVGWSPKKSERAGGLLTVNAVEYNTSEAVISASTNSVSHNWGGEIEGLPLNEYTGYTIFFTLTRSSSTASRDPNFALYVDGYYGFYGYSTSFRILKDMNTLSGHSTITFSELDPDIEGLEYEETGLSVQQYAIEVNGSNKTVKFFIMDKNSKYVLIDSSKKGEITAFYTKNLGIWFHQYNTDMPITIGYLTIWSGCILTGDKITPAPLTTTPAETEPVPEITDNTEDTTSADLRDETANPDETTTSEGTANPDETTEAFGTEEKGCGGAISGSVSLIALIPASLLIIKRKKKN